MLPKDNTDGSCALMQRGKPHHQRLEKLLKPFEISDNDISEVTNLMIDFITFLNNI